MPHSKKNSSFNWSNIFNKFINRGDDVRIFNPHVSDKLGNNAFETYLIVDKKIASGELS